MSQSGTPRKSKKSGDVIRISKESSIEKMHPKADPLVRFMVDEVYRQGITFSDLAKKSGVNKQSILSWRNRGNQPSLSNFIAVLNVLGYTIIPAKASILDLTKKSND